MFRRSLGMGLFLWLLSGAAEAQTRGGTVTFSISGRVVVPVAGFQDYFEVLLLQNAEQTVAYTYADSNGRYRFSGLSRGTYFISIKLEGFQEVRQRVDLGGGGGETIINIILDFKEERIITRTPDLSGEDTEVVDIAELNRKYPSRIVSQYEEAEEEVRKGNMLKAQQILESIVTEAPDFYFAHKTLGEVHQRAGRYRDAETEYNQARDLRPTSASPLVNLGSLYIQEADASARLGNATVRKILDQALDSLEVAVKLKPSAPFAVYLLGVAYYKSAFYEDAEDNLKRALQLEPRFAHARLALANVYIKILEWPNAVAQLDAFLAENPRSPDRPEVEATRARVVQRMEAAVTRRP